MAKGSFDTVNKIEEAITEIEEYLDSCKPKAFAASQIIVDRGQMEVFLEKLKKQMPEEIKKYQRLCANIDEKIKEAEETAALTIQEAEEKKAKMINEHDIVTQARVIADQTVMDAQEQADSIIAAANNDADTIRAGAIQYTDNLLSNIENILKRYLENSQQRYNQFTGVLKNSLSQVLANRKELNPNGSDHIQEDITKEDATE